MMKKIWFSLILVVYVNQTVFSCDCIFKSTFCEVTQNFKRTNSIIVKATVLSVNKEVAELQVLSVVVGDESRSIIKCFKHDPYTCGTVAFGNEGETFIYILNRIDTIYRFSPPNVQIKDYILPLCQFIKLRVEGDKIIGRITENKEQVMSENELLCGLLNTKNENLNKIKIAPNPTENKLFFRGIEKQINVAVFDIMGKMVFNQSVNTVQNFINIGDLASGIYIVRMQYLNDMIIVKIVKL
jgi:Secretion system C-terminal sorting domain